MVLSHGLPSKARVRALASALAFATLALGCNRSDPQKASTATASSSPSSSAAPSTHQAPGVRSTRAPAGEVAAIVREARERAVEGGRKLIVYVGATWCEPCRRFHSAAAAGELDKVFPDLNVLEFDLDEDRERLEKAGYTSSFIPLFVVPNEDGSASNRRFEGSVKGPGAIENIAPKLHALLTN